VRGALYIHFVAAAPRTPSCSLQTLFVFKQGLPRGCVAIKSCLKGLNL
jgi:hypothetical protein